MTVGDLIKELQNLAQGNLDMSVTVQGAESSRQAGRTIERFWSTDPDILIENGIIRIIP